MFNSGALIRTPDPRDIKLGKIQAPASLPSVYKPDMSWFVRRRQGTKPACGAFAGTHHKQILQHYDESSDKSPLSPVCEWKKIKQIDGVPLEDGTYSISIFKTLQKWGAVPYSTLNEDTNQTPEQYADRSQITSVIDDDASIRRDEAYAFVNVPSFEDVKQAIWRNKSCILILRGDDGFWRTTTPTFTTIKWGHFVCAWGWDETGIWIVDSAEYDDSYGFKHIDKKYFPSEFCPELSTSIDCSDKILRNLTSQIKLLREVVSLYMKLISMLKK